ncbi:MAG: hypothetical protein IKY83_01380 [Proteobacteria bacterium]|nr:hypothetical protein [Pseudomonadota bacterium]
MRKLIALSLSIFSLFFAFNAFADPAPADAPAAPVEEAEVPADSNDPGDVIARYFIAMSDIVVQNMDAPDAMLEKMSAYLKENEKAMRNASKAFDAKMGSLKGADAETYRETVQRKITPSLNTLISNLIDFADRYPVQAEKLDSMLKVDAKYTYQQ